MSLSLERLLLLAAPFFLAVSASKKKHAKRLAKKKSRAKPARAAVKRKRVKKPARRSSRAASKRQRRVKVKSPGRGRRAVPQKPVPKLATKPAAVPAPVEPPPIPVAPVGRPILLSPEQGKYADSVNPRFRWLSVGGATRYEVNWSRDANLANAYTVVSIATEAAVPVEKPLAIGATYYWRARGGNEAGWGPWSNIGSFGVIEETE
jgi:hypothetical protein